MRLFVQTCSCILHLFLFKFVTYNVIGHLAAIRQLMSESLCNKCTQLNIATIATTMYPPIAEIFQNGGILSLNYVPNGSSIK